MGMKVVAYYRVSTEKQGLGIDAQKTIVSNWATSHDAEVVAEFSEKVSGKNDNRQELAKAKELCEKEGFTLVVAKLDRLSRNMLLLVKMFADMTNKGAKFVVCNLPELTPLTLGIFAGLAEQERNMISERTKQALAELKRNGKKLGSPKGFTDEVKEKGRASRHSNAVNDENNRRAYKFAQDLKSKGMNLNAIAVELNRFDFKTRRGNAWSRASVENLFKVYANE